MEVFWHLFLPRSSNNHKAKILHSSGLVVIASALVIFQGLINFIPRLAPNILGYAAQISPDEVVRLTNIKRTEKGLSPLRINKTLSDAAFSKGRDMINRDYWAHVAPDGTQPWKFFNDFGYKYHFAGENLARDFSSAESAVNAWMNSPSHRDNILNPKYKEIGIGITEGDLAGIDTTIVVQFFGATYADKVVVPVAQVLPTATPEPVAVVASQEVLISPFTTTRFVSLSVVGILLFVFMLDALLVSRRRIARVAGRTFAHVAFLGLILTIILLLKSGQII